jgi:outer membrane protein assembly complex protein YaeT
MFHKDVKTWLTTATIAVWITGLSLWIYAETTQPAATAAPTQPAAPAVSAPVIPPAQPMLPVQQPQTSPPVPTPPPAQQLAPSVPAKTEDKLTASVDITGTVTVTRAQIFSAIRARAGQIFHKQTASEDAARIARLEGVESAYYTAEEKDGKIKLVYVVVEKQLVRELILDGNQKISDSKLVKELGFKPGDYMDVTAVRAGVEAFQKLYLEKGYAWAKITLDESDLAVGKVAYHIEEGPRPKIASIRFHDNRVLSDKKLRGAIKTKKKKFFFWSVYYNDDQIQKDVMKVQEVYQKRSYLDAKVDSKVTFSDDKKKAFLEFFVAEGPSYTTESITIGGNQFFDVTALREGLKLTEGGLYSADRAEFDTKKIRGRYQEMGFVDAKVDMKRTFLDGAKVRVEQQVTEGGRFRIGQVTITGNSVTHDNVIRRVLDEEKFTPGNWYNADVARGNGEGELEKTVKGTVYTESAIIQHVPSADPNCKDAMVSIKEGQTGSIMLGAGVGSDSGVVGQIAYDQRNYDISDTPESWNELITGKSFRGAGQRFRVSLNPGTLQSSYMISFTEPYLYDKPVSMEVAGTAFEREWESYTENRVGAHLGFEKRYSDDWRRGVSFRLENVGVDNLEGDAPEEVTDVEGDNMLAGARFYVGKDTTDSRFRPTKGYNFDFGYEQVGGDYTFGILSGTQRWYKTLYEDLSELKTVLETKVHGGMITGDAPLFEKFYAGGTSTCRGFDYRGISPRAKTNNDPIGSNWILNGSSEVAVPLGSDVFSWLFFVDGAMIETGTPRTAIGTGIQIQIPQWFGPVPMRFEVATPLTKDGQDDTRFFSFSVGALF